MTEQQKRRAKEAKNGCCLGHPLAVVQVELDTGHQILLPAAGTDNEFYNT